MGERSKIQWTDHTFNPWIGCTQVSPGCSNCYAMQMDKLRRWTPEGWGHAKPRRLTSNATWGNPLRWNRFAQQQGIRSRVFCASLADWLDDEVEISWLANLLQLIAKCDQLDWLLLTKRPQSWRSRLETISADRWIGPIPRAIADTWLFGSPPPNVWVGTTVEDQYRAGERIPILRSIPAQIRFLSCEPLLEPIRLDLEGIHWAIVGGESGPSARECDTRWIKGVVDQARKANVAPFVKQLGRKPVYDGKPIKLASREGGDISEFPSELQVREFPAVQSDRRELEVVT